MWKEKYQSMDNTKNGKRKGKLLLKMKKSLEERHTQTQGNKNSHLIPSLPCVHMDLFSSDCKKIDDY